MNKITILLLSFFIPVMAFAQFTIKGKIMDAKNIQDLNISLDVGMGINKSFAATIKGESYYIIGELEEPINSMLMVKNAGDDRGLKILLDNHSTYNIDILLKDNLEILDENWYEIKTTSIYHNTWRNFYDTQGELSDRKRLIQDDFENQIISKRDMDEKILIVDKKIIQQFKDLAYKEPSNFAVAYILNGAPDLSFAYLPYYEMLEDKVKNSFWGKRLKETIDKFAKEEYQYSSSTPILGTKTKLIKGRDIVGKPKSFTKDNLESKLTLIDFWASWCAPCRKENVNLVLMHNNYNKDDFRIISFSLDDNLERWEKASQQDNITWENISDLKGVQSHIMQDFHITELPRNIIVDSKGNIIATNKFGDNLKKFISKYLRDNS